MYMKMRLGIAKDCVVNPFCLSSFLYSYGSFLSILYEGKCRFGIKFCEIFSMLVKDKDASARITCIIV